MRRLIGENGELSKGGIGWQANIIDYFPDYKYSTNGECSLTPSENLVKTRLEKRGYSVIRLNGYGCPDFFVFKDDDFRFIEVKSREDKVRPHQEALHKKLRQSGATVDVIVVDIFSEMRMLLKREYKCRWSNDKFPVFQVYDEQTGVWAKVLIEP